MSKHPILQTLILLTMLLIPSKIAFGATETSVPGTSEIHGEQLTVDELKKDLKKYGNFISGQGMSLGEYEEAMNTPWIEIIDTGKYKKNTIDLSKKYSYDLNIRQYLTNLQRLDGVQLFDIGHTVEDRPIYMLKIDRTTVKYPKTIVLTGNTHARETAGSMYIVKQLNDLLNDPKADEYLSQVRIYAVPCVNPDGREGVAYDTKNFTYSDGLLWKANANGVDINRNFPGLSWGQQKKGYSKVSLLSNTPTKMYFPGYTAGSEPETKAMMKFLYHTIVTEQADILIDYHQQGRIQYAGKPWQTKAQQKRCTDLAKEISSILASGKTYKYTPENSQYGLRGEGSTLTDYACSLAVGAKFSEKYGFLVYTNGKKEYPLIMGKKVGTEANDKFATATIEIGSGTSYLGYSAATRKKLKTEYTTYHFDKLLYKLMDYVVKTNTTSSYIAGFKTLNQKDLPTGCESVSATMLLNHYGFKITKTEFVDKYLKTISSEEAFYKDKKNANKLVYDYYFVGNPRREDGKACNAPVIMDAITEYFEDVGEKEYRPVNLTGQSFYQLTEYTADGTPVLIWLSIDCQKPPKVRTVGKFKVNTQRHCLVLLGIDKKQNIAYLADPLAGKMKKWNLDKVIEVYGLYGKQAIVLEQK